MTASSLSVITCNYNYAHFIGVALQAMIEQSCRPTEILVVDDGSTDDSVAVVERMARRDPIVRLVRNDRNRGVMFTANRGLNLAIGEYVYFASADDRVLPGFFERSLSLLARFPQAGLCCSYPTSFDDATGTVHDNRFLWSEAPRYFSPEDLASALKGDYIPGHTSVIKRSALLGAGGLIPELRWHCDWFANLVVGFRHGICYIPESLAAIRVSPGSYSAAGRRDWSQQKQVLDHVLRLLKSSAYRDVLPLFQRADSLRHFGSQILRLVLGNPRHWDVESLRLIRGSLRYEAYRARRTFERRLGVDTSHQLRRLRQRFPSARGRASGQT